MTTDVVPKEAEPFNSTFQCNKGELLADIKDKLINLSQCFIKYRIYIWVINLTNLKFKT